MRTGNPWEGSLLCHLAHSAGPGLQTVSSICAKMLDPPSSKDELKGKGKPEEKKRLGRRMGAMDGASGSGSGREKGSSMSTGGLLPVKVTWVSGWRAHTQTYNILGLDEAEGFRAVF